MIYSILRTNSRTTDGSVLSAFIVRISAMSAEEAMKKFINLFQGKVFSNPSIDMGYTIVEGDHVT